MKRLAHASLLLCLIGLLGCGTSSIPVTNNEYVDIEGTVTLPNGQPLKQGMIHFEPDTPDKGRTDQAMVRDGSFKSKLAVAKYKVAFDIDNARGSLVPNKYTKFQTSDASAEVTSGGKVSIALK